MNKKQFVQLLLAMAAEIDDYAGDKDEISAEAKEAVGVIIQEFALTDDAVLNSFHGIETDAPAVEYRVARNYSARRNG